MPAYKTRLAPTPSGYLHLGNIFSFVRTLALAERLRAPVLLRIDDMDRERAAPHFIQDIFETLRFLDISWQEGPADVTYFNSHYAQHHRLPLYDAALKQLQDGGHLFACTCSRSDILKSSTDGGYPGTCLHKDLPLNAPGSALRLYTPETISLAIPSLDGAETVHRFPQTMRHFVVRKRDGNPAYQLCSVLDDLHFSVNLIVRGADLWPSTIAQYYLATVLGATAFTGANFFHHPLLLNAQGEKLSKSAGATSVYGLRKAGLSKEEVLGRLANLLGVDAPAENGQALMAHLEKNAAGHPWLRSVAPHGLF